MTNDLFRRMAENNAWANLRLHRAVGELSADEYRATRTSFFPSIHLTLVHILFVDLFYVDALEGGGRGAAIWSEADVFERDSTFAELRELQRSVDRRLIACTAGNPAGEVRIERGTVDAPMVRIDTRENVLLHVFHHQTHHRGQVHAMLAGTRVAPPQLDEFFLNEDAHLREAELRELGLVPGGAKTN